MFQKSQRWSSESEPELGLGAVEAVTERMVRVQFPASGETRQYAIDHAPLRRVRFRVGDTIASRDGTQLTIETVNERNGVIVYRGNGRDLWETELSDTISFHAPEERLLTGQIDPPELFELRVAALEQQHRRRRSEVRGFVGGRIDLIPHQLYIASVVTNRLAPRVLLADEVGLGKTIEACLILHRFIATGRVQRVLILVPESLVHQWFVELLRRFNLWFHIFDEERCVAIEASDPDANPFLDNQLVLCALDLLVKNERRMQQALAAGWDVLVVDEAHRLGWAPDVVSPEYAVVEKLGRMTPGLLLLTGTPEQLGMASHFGRLRLLDPARYYDLQQFILETEQYREVADVADKLVGNLRLADMDAAILARILVEEVATVRAQLKKIEGGDRSLREELINQLLDQHGTGRVMFRNTRATVAGFPKRVARIAPLESGTDGSELLDALAAEFELDTGTAAAFEPDDSSDPRMGWLSDLLSRLGGEKVLLICRTQRKAEAVAEGLRQRMNIKMALFHEGLPLIQRDRNAAWFADEEGARILICSEIGSEGRNFQFAHHLVLFDLPLDPELLEQRIGRLDRIGQTSEISVHVPFVRGSSQEVLVRWYHEGLNAFEKNLHGGRELLERFGSRVHDLAQDFHETGNKTELQHLIQETAAARIEIAERLEAGRDRLLELNSFRSDVATEMVEAIRKQDNDQALDHFMLSVFDHYSIHVEELGGRTYQLGSSGVFADMFPGLPAEGLTVTCERRRALEREDIQFFTWDHPLVTGALDLLLGAGTGNSSFAVWPDNKVAGLYVETIYLIECIAPPHLHIDRFLPPTPLRIVVDHQGRDASGVVPSKMQRLKIDVRNLRLLDRPEIRDELIPMLLERALGVANSQIGQVIDRARTTMNKQLEREISRLKELQKVNPNVRTEEIDSLAQQKTELDKQISAARLRLDAIRLIQRGPHHV